jgi:hypothetical protein
MSSLNSDCMAGVHNSLPVWGESSNVLDERLRFSDGSISNGVVASSGLGSGDSAAESHGDEVAVLGSSRVDDPLAGGWDQLAECERRRVGWGCSSALASARAAWARALVVGSTYTHLQRCGTIFCFGFPAIG